MAREVILDNTIHRVGLLTCLSPSRKSDFFPIETIFLMKQKRQDLIKIIWYKKFHLYTFEWNERAFNASINKNL